MTETKSMLGKDFYNKVYEVVLDEETKGGTGKEKESRAVEILSDIVMVGASASFLSWKELLIKAAIAGIVVALNKILGHDWSQQGESSS